MQTWDRGPKTRVPSRHLPQHSALEGQPAVPQRSSGSLCWTGMSNKTTRAINVRKVFLWDSWEPMQLSGRKFQNCTFLFANIGRTGAQTEIETRLCFRFHFHFWTQKGGDGRVIFKTSNFIKPYRSMFTLIPRTAFPHDWISLARQWACKIGRNEFISLFLSLRPLALISCLEDQRVLKFMKSFSSRYLWACLFRWEGNKMILMDISSAIEIFATGNCNCVKTHELATCERGKQQNVGCQKKTSF